MGNSMAEVCTIAVVIPVLNEADNIGLLLQSLDRDFDFDEIWVVDGGSDDTTVMVVQTLIKQTPTEQGRPSRVRLIHSKPSRAGQMNAGADHAGADVLLFLHADTRIPAGADALIRQCIRQGRKWGRFDIRFADRAGIFRIIAWMMNIRSALTGIATGDQAVFVRRDLFKQLGGYPDIAIMEDIALCRRLKRIVWPARIRQPAVTSTRRWRHYGIVRTILLMWVMRFSYWIGIAPGRLARWYR